MSARFAVEKQVQFLWCIIGDLFVVVEEARTRIDIALQIGQAWGNDSSLVQRLRFINQRLGANANLTAKPTTLRTHPLRIVKREDIRVTHVRLAEPRKEQA